jgi:hypothetical protein
MSSKKFHVALNAWTFQRTGKSCAMDFKGRVYSTCSEEGVRIRSNLRALKRCNMDEIFCVIVIMSTFNAYKK